MKKTGISILMFLVLVVSSYGQSKPKPFEKGDRVVFAGNSITEAGFYLSYIWLYYMVHYPERRIKVINAGVGGDVAEQIYRRLEGDILPKKPTDLIISFGMNDSKYFEYNDKKDPMTPEKRQAIVDVSYKSYLKIEDELKKHPDIHKILMASSPYDETVQQKGDVFHGKSETMADIVAFQKKAAKKNDWSFVDLFHPMNAIDQREQKKDPSYTSTGPDRIHPGSAGHFIMAYLFLKDQGLGNTPVADFSINAGRKKVSKTANCTISDIAANEGNLSFDYLAKSLPFPLDTVARVWNNEQVQTEALDVIPFVDEFDREIMKISGLTGKSYLLKIDQQPIAVYTGEALAKGVNLAMQKNTPQYQQALEIMDLNSKRKEIEGKFRNYYWIQYNFLDKKGLLFDTTQVSEDTIANNMEKDGWLKAKYGDYEAVRNSGDKLKAQMKTYVDKIYSINHPKKRHFELIEQ